MLKSAGLAGLVVVLAVPCHSQDSAMTLDRVEYLISELPEYPDQLTMTRDELRYESHSNASRPDVGIGLFVQRTEPGDVEAIEARVTTSTFRALPDHRGKVLSGDRVKRIRLTIGDETIEKMVGTALPIDPELQRVIDVLDAVVERVVRFPKQALQMHLAGALSGRDFSGTIAFRSAGDTPAPFELPGPAAGERQGSLSLYWWPYVEGQPKSDVHVAAVTVLPAATATPAEVGIASRLDELPDAGRIAVQVRYLRLTPSANAADATIGQLFSNLIILR